MQRILSRGEIEGLDHTLIPRVILPEPSSVFADRAARMRMLAKDHSLSGYLLLMAHVADAQQHALLSYSGERVSDAQVSRAQSYGMPPLQAVGAPRDRRWRDILDSMLAHVTAASGVPAPAIDICRALQDLASRDPDALEALADKLLDGREGEVDSAAAPGAAAPGAMAPFVMSALQVVWTAQAGVFDHKQLPVVSPFGVCPACGSLPVASIVRVGGRRDGCRYMCCGLCATEWHLVRVVCSHCEETKDVAYHSIEGGSDAIKAESCDHCRVYRKIFYQEKDLYVDPVADDLATLTLDVLMGQEGYSRASGNPLLWQPTEAEG